jgi:hypothetical protein
MTGKRVRSSLGHRLSISSSESLIRLIVTCKCYVQVENILVVDPRTAILRTIKCQIGHKLRGNLLINKTWLKNYSRVDDKTTIMEYSCRILPD